MTERRTGGRNLTNLPSMCKIAVLMCPGFLLPEGNKIGLNQVSTMPWMCMQICCAPDRASRNCSPLWPLTARPTSARRSSPYGLRI